MSNLGVPADERPVPLWAILLVLVLILTGGGFLARTLLDDGKDEVSYPANWDPRVLPFAKIAEKQRGLTFRHPVTVRFLPAEKFKKGVTTDEKELDKEDRKEIEQFTGMLRALGLIKGDLDLFDSVNEASGAGTLAYYSFEDKRITIRGEKITPAMRSTMVHELTHVLQDQHFDIGAMQKKLEKSKDDDSDEEATVLDALIEGDADRVETSYRQSLTAKQRKALDSSKQGQSEEVDKTYKKIPKIILTMMTSPYTLGEAMVQAAAADGGNSAVDALFRKTPPNESALLDPLKGLTERGDTVDVDAPEGRGRREEDRLRRVRRTHVVPHAGGAAAAPRRPRRPPAAGAETGTSPSSATTTCACGRSTPGAPLRAPDDMLLRAAALGRRCAGVTGQGQPRWRPADASSPATRARPPTSARTPPSGPSTWSSPGTTWASPSCARVFPKSKARCLADKL